MIMRTRSAGMLAVIALLPTFLAPCAAAQVRRGPAPGAMIGRGLSPSTPTPHFASPAPHLLVAPPNFSPHRFSAPAPNLSAPAVGLSVHPVVPQPSTPDAHAPAVVIPPATPRNIVTAPGVGNRNAALPSQNFVPGHGPLILRNPAYANISADDPANQIFARSIFGGRFARARLVTNADHHRRPFGRVIGFLGPIFWPYGYDDFVDYTFSPYAYDTFWPYAYDDVLIGLYGAYYPAYSDPGPNPNYGSGGIRVFGNQTGAWITSTGSSSGQATPPESARQICSGQIEGLAEYPIQRIAQQVQPDRQQQDLLDDLKIVTAEALQALKAACPSDLPSTPTGRLAAMRSRVESMLEAVRMIQPTLQRFYQSLSDEQKERLNVLDVEKFGVGEIQEPDPVQLCRRESLGSNLSTIDRVLHLSDAQQMLFIAFKEASIAAADVLKESCSNEPILTPTARLAQMKRRLEAMLQMLDTVRPALINLYNSLDDEQKARFNRFGARSF